VAFLPRKLAVTTESGVPRRAVFLLSGLFAVVGTVLVIEPGVVVDAVATASSIFIVLYLLSIVSYARVRGLTVRSVLNLLLLAVLGASLIQSGWRSLYAVVVLAVALTVQVVQSRRSEKGSGT